VRRAAEASKAEKSKVESSKVERSKIETAKSEWPGLPTSYRGAARDDRRANIKPEPIIEPLPSKKVEYPAVAPDGAPVCSRGWNEVEPPDHRRP